MHSVGITYKAVSAGGKAGLWTLESKGPAEPTSQPRQSHRKQNRPGFAPPDSWVWSGPVTISYFKRKIGFWQILAATQIRLKGSHSTPGPWGPSCFLGETLQLPEALGKLWRSRKGFILAPGWFFTHKSVVLPGGGRTGCLQTAGDASTLATWQFQRGLWKLEQSLIFCVLGTLNTGEITRSLLGSHLRWWHCFIPGQNQMSSFQVSSETQRSGHLWRWGEWFTDYPKASLEKNKNFTERVHFWENQVTFITSILYKRSNNCNRERR